MADEHEEKVDTQALVNAIIWTGLLLSLAAVTLIVINVRQANQAAKRANAADLSRLNGTAPGADRASSEDIAAPDAA
jgi:hypothetical protein